MSDSSQSGANNQTPDEKRGDSPTNSGDVGGRARKADIRNTPESSDADDNGAKSLGRPSDYGSPKRTRTIRLTDAHWELWRRAAYPQARTPWLESHLEQNKDKIQRNYNESKD